MLTLPLEAEAIAARLPHGRALCLLDRMVAVDARWIHCEATSHRAAGNPLRVDGRLGAACAVEYAAQAMALHGAVLRGDGEARGERGMLVAVRDLTLCVPRLDDLPPPLRIACERLDDNTLAVSYRFGIESGDGRIVAEGRAMLMRGEPPLDEP